MSLRDYSNAKIKLAKVFDIDGRLQWFIGGWRYWTSFDGHLMQFLNFLSDLFILDFLKSIFGSCNVCPLGIGALEVPSGNGVKVFRIAEHLPDFVRRFGNDRA